MNNSTSEERYKEFMTGFTTAQREKYMKQVRRFEGMNIAVPTGLIRKKVLSETTSKNTND